MYLQMLRDIVQLQARANSDWELADAKRKQLAQAVASTDTDTSEVAKYVTVMNRTAKLELPEAEALRQQIEAAKLAQYETNAEAVYEAQQVLQAADEALAALLTTPEIVELSKQLDIVLRESASSQPERTVSLVLRKGSRIAIASQLAQQQGGPE